MASDPGPDQPRVNGSGSNHISRDRPVINGTSSDDALSHASNGPSLISTPNHSSTASKLVSSTSYTSYDPTPPKASSPLAVGLLDPRQKPISPPATTNSTAHSPPAGNVSEASRRSARPGRGEAKGYRAVYDPELDPKVSKEARRKLKAKVKPFGEEQLDLDPPPDPRLAIAGYSSGHCVPKTATSKGKLRIAPYTIKPYPHDSKHTITPDAPKHVVVTGFDPFIPESNLRTFFSSFGSIAELRKQIDPTTGTSLSICLIKYKDTKPLKGAPQTATQAAKNAEQKADNERIGVRTIKVQRDREGRRCKKYVEQHLARAKARAAVRKLEIKPAPTQPSALRRNDLSAAPVNAPRGPAGRAAVRTSDSPFTATSTTARKFDRCLEVGRDVVEPYIFISAKCIPLDDFAHDKLRARMNAVFSRLQEIKPDRTGYYICFTSLADMRHCFNKFHTRNVRNWTMTMEAHPQLDEDDIHDPVLVKARRADSREPERKVRRDDGEESELDMLRREEAEDRELEKKQRAEGIDPVVAAASFLASELQKKAMDEIKMRIIIPFLDERLDPTLHAAKRRKLGLAGKDSVVTSVSPVVMGRVSTPPATPKGPSNRSFGHSRPLRPHDPNAQRINVRTADAFVDSRRRKKTARARPQRLQDMLQAQADSDDDSDDDSKTPITSRDHEDNDSRPPSSMSRTSTPFDHDMFHSPKPSKAKDTPSAVSIEKSIETEEHSDHIEATPVAEQPWEETERPEKFEAWQKQLLGDLLTKTPEIMALRELEQIVNTLPRSSKFQERCRLEMYQRQREKGADEIFKIKADSTTPAAERLSDVMDLDTPAQTATAASTKKKSVTKKKSKKELAAERAARAQAAADVVASDTAKVESVVEIKEIKDRTGPAIEIPVELPDWAVSTFEPCCTIEDEADVALDLEGWQHLIKDDEDLVLLSKALSRVQAADIPDVQFWAWKQKHIKTLNVSPDQRNALNATVSISGYYVPNDTGSARTEGVKKILNSEKSKYLPHRIKVQKAREEREAMASKDQAQMAESSKASVADTFKATSSSRSNRANNRRLVNDINLQKQHAPTSGADTDAFRFNQLKKRKKHVRFDRSAIHGWGLYTEENIVAGDLIIEYVGEKIRQKVADMREIAYTRQGIGSSYLFRMADDEIIDATKKGGIARFINHSCMPNCTAKIIKVEGTRRIVIYALKDIGKGEELTYDYKFERELLSTDRIPCLCGSVGCKGFLN